MKKRNIVLGTLAAVGLVFGAGGPFFEDYFIGQMPSRKGYGDYYIARATFEGLEDLAVQDAVHTGRLMEVGVPDEVIQGQATQDYLARRIRAKNEHIVSLEGQNKGLKKYQRYLDSGKSFTDARGLSLLGSFCVLGGMAILKQTRDHKFLSLT